MPKLSEKVQQARRARILDAAERCFARSGFQGATMQEICREAGVSAGALYVYFRSKEELIEGLSRRDRAQVREEFAHAALDHDLVKGMAQVLHAAVLDRPLDKVRLLIEMGAESGRSPAVSRTLCDCDADIRGALEDILADAARRGQIAPTMPIADVATLMIVTVDGLFFRRVTDPAFDAARIGPNVLRMFSGILGVEAGALPLLLAAYAGIPCPAPPQISIGLPSGLPPVKPEPI